MAWTEDAPLNLTAIVAAAPVVQQATAWVAVHVEVSHTVEAVLSHAVVDHIAEVVLSHVAVDHIVAVVPSLVVALTDMAAWGGAAKIKAPAPALQHSSCAALRSLFYDNTLPVWPC